MEKYGTARQATNDNTLRRMRTAYWISKATDTFREYVIRILNCGFSIPLCVRIMVYFNGPSLHNNLVQCLCKANAVLPHLPWLIPLFYKPDDDPVGSKHVTQLLVA